MKIPKETTKEYIDENMVEIVNYEDKEEASKDEKEIIDNVEDNRSSQASFDNTKREEESDEDLFRKSASIVKENKYLPNTYEDTKDSIIEEGLRRISQGTSIGGSFDAQEALQKYIKGELELSFQESDNYIQPSIFETEADENEIIDKEDEFEIGDQSDVKINKFYVAEEMEHLCEKADERENYGINSEDYVEEADFEDVFENNRLSVGQSDETKQFPTPTSVSDEENEISIKTGSDDIKLFVTVKFRFDNNETMTSTFKIHTKVCEVKERLALILKIKSDDILLNHEGNECDDILPLSGLGAEPLGTIELGIQSANPKTILAPVHFRHYIPVVDVITVRIPLDEGDFKDTIVEIENQNFPKEWLGGYRHRLTKIEYHHAAAQTMLRKRSMDLPNLFCRETQTPVFPFKEIAVETKASKSTQMWRSDHYIPDVNDKVIIGNSSRFRAKKTSLKFFQLVIWVSWMKRVIKILLARHKEREMELYNEICLRNEKLAEETREKMWLKRNEREIVGKTFPTKQEDFYMLYLMIGKWWKKEVEKIKKTKHSEARKAAFIQLLEKEIELLSVIDRQRIQAKKDLMKKQEIHFLETTARPIIFCNNKGVIASIDTVETQQAREYKEILSSFMKTNVTTEERIDILNTLKCLIKQYGFYEYTNEIISLIERECHLLLLGMKDKQLKGLRERIEQLIMYYLHEHIVNPSSKRYKKPNESKTNSNFYLCHYCKKLKPVSDFNIHVKMTSFKMCRSCQWTKNIGHQRIDLSPYARLLDHIRQTEMENCCYSSICFVLQVTGMYYLIRNIWNNQSITSENDNLDDLRMVRFKRDEDWSPWNCILLTLEESIVHLNISDIENIYDQWLLNKIKWKHMRAKNHFLPLLVNDNMMREPGLWFDVKDSGKFLQSSNFKQFVTSTDFKFL